MINYDLIELDMFGDIVLTDSVTCPKDVFERMVSTPEDELTPWWKNHLRNWEEKGIIDRS